MKSKEQPSAQFREAVDADQAKATSLARLIASLGKLIKQMRDEPGPLSDLTALHVAVEVLERLRDEHAGKAVQREADQ